jgi:hypothetical protein
LKCEKIWTIWKKGKLNSEKIWKIWKKSKLNSEKIWTIWNKRKLKYSWNENFNLLHSFEWDRIVTLNGAQAAEPIHIWIWMSNMKNFYYDWSK